MVTTTEHPTMTFEQAVALVGHKVIVRSTKFNGEIVHYVGVVLDRTESEGDVPRITIDRANYFEEADDLDGRTSRPIGGSSLLAISLLADSYVTTEVISTLDLTFLNQSRALRDAATALEETVLLAVDNFLGHPDDVVNVVADDPFSGLVGQLLEQANSTRSMAYRMRDAADLLYEKHEALLQAETDRMEVQPVCKTCGKAIVPTAYIVQSPLTIQSMWQHEDGTGVGVSEGTRAQWCETPDGYVKVEPAEAVPA